ncbi:amidohydrolase [Alcanivorax sp. S6407]|uniref:amidohydrolase n=1 Tax=Alcanivorax sp. S6407 TaxID=2926424 RepID=UPI001FF0EC2F|nr:amidohydrolase [Alcanivorax sp. S6407]MCK0154599.1 amidohydrolase [Alcanivorax sp. S6407]
MSILSGRGWLAGSLVAALLLTGCDAKAPQESADVLYSGGSILTMVGDTPSYAEALLVKDGRILFVGDLAKARDAAKAEREVDLQGHTLLPGFIDGHGHIYNAGIQKLVANLLPPPDGDGHSVASLVELLKAWQGQNDGAITKTGWIIGFGYDDSQLQEQRHPTASELDRVATDTPVLIIHQSGHLGAMNHKGLELAGITADTANPEGGVIRREADGKTPNGVLEEMAMFQPLFRLFGELDADSNEKIALAGVDAYKENGFTTAQEGRASPPASETWRKLANEGRLELDVAVYPDVQSATDYLLASGVSPTYQNHFRIAGAKLSLDGSPQGKTAWLSKPYKVPPEGKSADYAGYPAIPAAEERQRLVNLAFENNWQLLTHCNGDAAAQALIDAVAVAADEYGNDDRRTVMIHAQTITEAQLDQMQALKIMPSFFSMHTYYWGDWHRDQTLGKEWAYHISPTASALKRGMIFTEHHDAPVALPSAIMILYTTVNRISRSGDIIGPGQRVSPYIGLKSLTEWGAWQYFEEGQKGTLEPGKLADFVILDKDPLVIPPEEIINIRVLETIKEGKSIYQAP